MNRLIIFDFNRTLYDPDARSLMPGALPLLDHARDQGYVLVLLAQAAPSRQAVIDELGIKDYFAEIHLVEHKTASLLADIAARHAADPAHSVVIGDRATGEIALGAAAGWRTIWLKAGRFAGELPYPDRPPTHTVHSLTEALNLI